MSSTSALETVHRFRDILALVSRGQVRTAYEISHALELPVSSTYLAVAELERLSCLARDESGNLLVGVRLQQVALDALGFREAAQQLPPLVRYLRDRTGETIFVGNLGSDAMTVGPVAIGFNAGCLAIQPFQAFGLVVASPRVSEEDAIRMELINADLQPSAFLGVELARSSLPGSQDILVLGTARVGDDIPDSAQLIRNLSDARGLFRAPRDPTPAHAVLPRAGRAGRVS